MEVSRVLQVVRTKALGFTLLEPEVLPATLRPSEEHVAGCLTSTMVSTRLGTLAVWLSRGQLGPGHTSLETAWFRPLGGCSGRRGVTAGSACLLECLRVAGSCGNLPAPTRLSTPAAVFLGRMLGQSVPSVLPLTSHAFP